MYIYTAIYIYTYSYIYINRFNPCVTMVTGATKAIGGFFSLPMPEMHPQWTNGAGWVWSDFFLGDILTGA